MSNWWTSIERKRIEIPKISRVLAATQGLGRPKKKKCVELFDVPLSEYAMERMKIIEAEIRKSCMV